MHTQAISSLLVTTAVTSAARPITANTIALISICRPPAGPEPLLVLGIYDVAGVDRSR